MSEKAGKRPECVTCKYEYCGACTFDGTIYEDCNGFCSEHKPAEEPEAKPEHDAVNHPQHYTQGGVECIDALAAATAGLHGIEAVCTANAIKYLWRWKRKNGTEDLRKAIWYIERLRKEVEKDAAD